MKPTFWTLFIIGLMCLCICPLFVNIKVPVEDEIVVAPKPNPPIVKSNIVLSKLKLFMRTEI